MVDGAVAGSQARAPARKAEDTLTRTGLGSLKFHGMCSDWAVSNFSSLLIFWHCSAAPCSSFLLRLSLQINGLNFSQTDGRPLVGDSASLKNQSPALGPAAAAPAHAGLRGISAWSGWHTPGKKNSRSEASRAKNTRRGQNAPQVSSHFSATLHPRDARGNLVGSPNRPRFSGAPLCRVWAGILGGRTRDFQRMKTSPCQA